VIPSGSGGASLTLPRNQGQILRVGSRWDLAGHGSGSAAASRESGARARGKADQPHTQIVKTSFSGSRPPPQPGTLAHLRGLKASSSPP